MRAQIYVLIYNPDASLYHACIETSNFLVSHHITAHTTVRNNSRTSLHLTYERVQPFTHSYNSDALSIAHASLRNTSILQTGNTTNNPYAAPYYGTNDSFSIARIASQHLLLKSINRFFVDYVHMTICYNSRASLWKSEYLHGWVCLPYVEFLASSIDNILTLRKHPCGCKFK